LFDSWTPSGALSAPGDPVEGVPPEGWWSALLGSGPPFRVVRSFQHVGQGPVLPIVDGLKGSGTAGYAGLHVVHSERKFQSHPAVPPGRLIDLRLPATMSDVTEEWVAAVEELVSIMRNEAMRLPLDSERCKTISIAGFGSLQKAKFVADDAIDLVLGAMNTRWADGLCARMGCTRQDPCCH
jgi:hypothetical protein